MKFEEALVELRKGKEISSRGISLKVINDLIGFSDYPYETTPISIINTIFHSQWEVLEKPGKSFDQVLEAFKEGKSIHRKSWKDKIKLNNKGWTDSRTIFTDDYDLSIEDILATDWEVID